MTSKHVLGGALAVAIATVALGAGFSQAADAPKIALAALTVSSAKAPFEALTAMFEKTHPGVSITIQYLGGGQISTAIDGDTAADIVLAGSAPLDKVRGKIETAVTIYNTKDILITPKNNPAKIHDLKDLANPGVKIAMGTSTSAVGAISSTILQNAGKKYGFDFVQKVLANKSYESEKGSDVVDAVATGKADAALVFVSDGDPKKFNIIQISDDFNVTSHYQGTVTKNAQHAKLGEEFVKLMASKQGQAVFHAEHYLPPTDPTPPAK
jgi:molybdate transport system substrate-binding protein